MYHWTKEVFNVRLQNLEKKILIDNILYARQAQM